ncbi:MAG: FAD-dependent thymidylate synthase [Acidaminococcus intestini]|uniref:FAD-dependent thymidylate synthase n=1 Tax=Acidaminococcus intestini TaxID=187327 RepID=A0A943ECG9_9FIRM|nr:FAD-dependent thymidylate synthase [Acidaminococcus intestini]
MPKAKLISMTSNPMDLLKKAAGMCYQKEATDRVIQHIIKAGHLSVLEHCSASFEVTCSILTLLQLTRHRHLSFTCQSSRGSELQSFYKTGDEELDLYIEDHFDCYRDFIEQRGFSPEMAAYLIPKGGEYKLVVSGNFRAWYEYLPKRLCKRASKEHKELAQLILKELQEACPEVFGDLTAPCATCKESGCNFA